MRIDEVNNDALFPLGIVYSGVQGCKVTVLSGEHAGESAWASNYLNSALDKDKLFEQGDIAYAMVQTGPQGLTVTLIDHDRTGAELAILLSLSALLLLYGGLVGFGALVSLVASVLIVWKLLLPLLIEGVNPIGAAFLTVVALTVIIDLLVGGLSRKTLVAVIGSLLGTVVTCVLAVALTDALKLDGGDVPYLVPLLSQAHMDIDARALFCGMMFIANSGALMDLAMDISASTEEICRHKPDIAFRDLLLSGMTIGRYTLGTMTTTLMLAYSGNYLSMLMYFMGQGRRSSTSSTSSMWPASCSTRWWAALAWLPPRRFRRSPRRGSTPAPGRAPRGWPCRAARRRRGQTHSARGGGRCPALKRRAAPCNFKTKRL